MYLKARALTKLRRLLVVLLLIFCVACELGIVPNLFKLTKN